MNLSFRKALISDIPSIVQLLANDKLGALREDINDLNKYNLAFEKIDKDENQELIVIENEQGEIIGTLQLSFIQYLTYQGGIRAQIEAVRIREDQRGKALEKLSFNGPLTVPRQKGLMYFNSLLINKDLMPCGFMKN